jgi:hypothetical protein
VNDRSNGDDVYRLKAPGIELTYRPGDGKLDISSDDDGLLNQDDLDANATADPETGLHVTATLLESSRDGTRVMLTLLLPELSGGPRRVRTQQVTAVAIVTSSFRHLLDGPPPVLQRHDDVHRLEGTAVPAD